MPDYIVRKYVLMHMSFGDSCEIYNINTPNRILNNKYKRILNRPEILLYVNPLQTARSIDTNE